MSSTTVNINRNLTTHINTQNLFTRNLEDDIRKVLFFNSDKEDADPHANIRLDWVHAGIPVCLTKVQSEDEKGEKY